MVTCSITGCGGKAIGRGWCRKHYSRWSRHGDPVATSRVVGDDATRFWAYVDFEAGDGCWLWRGATVGQQGHGRLRMGNAWVYAHRWAYEFCVGPVPAGLVLDHLCRTEPCVNPDHLEPVTVSENTLRGLSPAAREARATTCKRGHPWDEPNTLWYRGTRYCRACVRVRRSLRKGVAA